MEVDVAKGRQCVEAILKSDVGIRPENAEGRFLRYIVNEVAFQKRTEGIVVFPLPKETLDELGYKELAAAFAKPANAADAMEAAQAWVRETASRLRQGLRDYYAKGKGKADPYQIMLPRRGYVPEFSPIDEPIIDAPIIDEPIIDEPIIDGPIIDAPIIDAPIIDEPRIPWIKWIVVAVLVVVILAGGIVWFRVRSTGPPPPPPGFHFLDIQEAAAGAEVHYGTVVRGRLAQPAENMYLFVLDGSTYWVQHDDQGRSPLIPCPDGSWERQAWPGTPEKGDGATYTLVVVRSNRPLPQQDSFLKTDLPAGAQTLKTLTVRRVPPRLMKPYIASCPPV